MKTIAQWALITSLMLLGLSVNAQEDEQSIYTALEDQMKRACPAQWEELGSSMNTENLTGEDVWQGDADDKAEFVTLLEEIATDSNGLDPNFLATDLATVATECASHRVALLDALISKTPRDVLLAMDAVNKGLNKTVEYLDGGWTVGDVRITGRLEAQEGWIFLTGQTVGPVGSSADLVGEEYNELYELAKNWLPNIGDESWSLGQQVKLPDMRGRTIMAPDNLGGTNASVTTSPNMNYVGGTIGSQQHQLAEDEMPAHSHGMNNGGTHTHTMQNTGAHTHNFKATGLTGSNYSGWYDVGGEMKGRDGEHLADNYFSKMVLSAGNHTHNINTSGSSHNHSIQSTGGNQPFQVMQPSITFNVEMKY